MIGSRTYRRTWNSALLLGIFLLWMGAPVASAQNQAAGVKPPILDNVGIDQKLDATVSLDTAFRDEHGKSVTLSIFFGKKPVILTLVYYQCPMLCTEVLNGLLNSLKEVPLEIGKDFEVVTVSIDPKDSSVFAEAKQTMYAGLYGRSGARHGWHFLTGDEPHIKRLADEVGFRYAYDPVSGQFAHASTILLLTPEGRVSRYMFGVRYDPRTVRLGLVEASAGKIGTLLDQVLLLCYHYDPLSGRYGLLISRVIKGAGIFTVLLIGLSLWLLRRSENYSLPARRA
ncbi:MAG TPA: SCO family protein [Candidatus Acidoferrales bacterium]|nr:SCO family protein [Candidatus Acidoferrales bacterium]